MGGHFWKGGYFGLFWEDTLAQFFLGGHFSTGGYFGAQHTYFMDDSLHILIRFCSIYMHTFYMLRVTNIAGLLNKY